jgi:signal transduction histidine kinase
MFSRTTAKAAFSIAIALLLVSAVLVYGTLANFARSEAAIEHTQRVQQLLGQTESAIASAARDRLIYVFNGDNSTLALYEQSVSRIRESLSQLRRITSDNPTQQRYCDRLEDSVNSRIELWEKSIALKKSGVPAAAGQPQMTRQSLEFANDIVAVTHAMGEEESRLLQQRIASARVHFGLLIGTLAVAFSASVLLLLWHYRLLRTELRARLGAEQSASEAAKAAGIAEQKAYEAERAALASHEAARRLSARLLELRDDERRRLSRELHDSVGQYLAAAKMTVAALANGRESDPRFAECINLLDQSLKEVRTLSHLLHPPGLDETGFASAATIYAQEFARRSGLKLKLEIPEPPARLPSSVELALFRVLQESLTNIHRHSKSESAEVTFASTSNYASLSIGDHGVGVPAEVLERFKVSGTSGVGLAGMRERIRELGGRFEVESSKGGTCVRVSVPLGQNARAGTRVLTADSQL